MATYFITGCGRGIGLAMTKALLSRGDRVIGSTRDGKAPMEHKNLRIVRMDVRDDASIRDAAAAITDPIDVLVNNSGIIGEHARATIEATPEDFAEVLNVNVLGPLRVTRAFLAHLRRGKNAKIMTVSSQMGGMTYPGSDRIAYRASKAAVNKLMQGFAEDLAPEKIAVVVAHPGWVKTDMGGQNAEIDADTSAAGLIRLLDQATVAKTGRFFNWDGTERAW